MDVLPSTLQYTGQPPIIRKMSIMPRVRNLTFEINGLFCLDIFPDPLVNLLSTLCLLDFLMSPTQSPASDYHLNAFICSQCSHSGSGPGAWYTGAVPRAFAAQSSGHCWKCMTGYRLSATNLSLPSLSILTRRRSSYLVSRLLQAGDTLSDYNFFICKMGVTMPTSSLLQNQVRACMSMA